MSDYPKFKLPLQTINFRCVLTLSHYIILQRPILQNFNTLSTGCILLLHLHYHVHLGYLILQTQNISSAKRYKNSLNCINSTNSSVIPLPEILAWQFGFTGKTPSKICKSRRYPEHKIILIQANILKKLTFTILNQDTQTGF